MIDKPVPNFLSTIYVDQPFRIGKQGGPFADPKFYVIENLGWDDSGDKPAETIRGYYATLEIAKLALGDMLNAKRPVAESV